VNATQILVVGDGAANVEQVKALLRDEYGNVAVSIDPERAIADFEKYHPAVLILAFDTLEKAERYYLGLYRLSSVVHALPHRTLILCNKEDVRRVYELCKKDYFDDYVLFWPMTHDAPRLPMAVHHAVRQLAHANASEPTTAEMAVQARRIAELESLLMQSVARGGLQIDLTSRSLQRAGRDIGAALDDFSRNLSVGDRSGIVEIKDRAGFQKEINRLKTDEIDKRFESLAAAVHKVRQWAGALNEEFAPQLGAASILTAMVERIRPVVLVVDDDEFQHKLLARALISENLDLFFVTSGAEALAALRKRRPDLVLMDVYLPDMNGVEVTRRLKSVEEFAHIPILMITGQIDRKVFATGVQAGASDFVVKPFDKDILLKKMRRLLNDNRFTHARNVQTSE
jgi:PleD family two-component response regulator